MGRLKRELARRLLGKRVYRESLRCFEEAVTGSGLELKTLPPVELYKIGGAYFVVDGNHRVSVARYRGAAAVDAIVTEFA